jgi:hypothetical protein
LKERRGGSLAESCPRICQFYDGQNQYTHPSKSIGPDDRKTKQSMPNAPFVCILQTRKVNGIASKDKIRVLLFVLCAFKTKPAGQSTSAPHESQFPFHRSYQKQK